MFPPPGTTRSRQLLELSIKSDDILKFAICSLSFPCRPYAVFSHTSLRLFLCVRTGSRSGFTCWLYHDLWKWNLIIIRSKLFFLFIGQEPTTWPSNNCLQIMVCSYTMPSNSVWLQIIFCSCVKKTVLFSFLRSLLRENGRSLRFPRIFIKKNKRGDRMIKQLLNSVIAKYRDLSVFGFANNWSARNRQITIFCSTSSNNC